MTEVYQRIIETLKSRGTEYTTEHHEAVTTSEAASKVRGVSMHAGAKALGAAR
jgi:prolyl-tRNA editing enzyme YbaK/EbsC (Cys-tRNA(Pro) deacylase)